MEVISGTVRLCDCARFVLQFLPKHGVSLRYVDTSAAGERRIQANVGNDRRRKGGLGPSSKFLTFTEHFVKVSPKFGQYLQVMYLHLVQSCL